MVVPSTLNLPAFTGKRGKFFSGILLLGISSAGAWLAHNEWRNQALVLLFTATAAVVILCLLYVLGVAGAVWIRVRRVGNIPAIKCLCEKSKALESLMPGFLALLVKLEVSWRLVRKKDGRTIALPIEVDTDAGREVVTFNRRCHIDFEKTSEFELERKVFVEDPLGLFAFPIKSQVKVAEIFVKPKAFDGTSPNRMRAIADAAGAKASASGNPQGDMVEMREYQEGDSVRLMLWKVLAKTDGQRKMVRTEERVESQRTAFYFFATGAEDNRAASFVIHYLQQKQLAGDWVLGVSGTKDVFCRSAANGLEKAMRAISKSGLEEFDATESMRAFEYFRKDIKTSPLRIENPIAVVGGSKECESTRQFCERIRTQAPRCGILVVPAEGVPFFWKEHR